LKQEKILFVCSGNTCRSVIAQALFQKLKDEIDLELNFQADSAGIHALVGTAPPPEAILLMARYGLDISTHRARQVDHQLINNSLFILAMTSQQKQFLQKHFPNAVCKIFLFRTFCYPDNRLERKGVEDPYGKTLSFYENLSSQLEQDITNLIHHLREEK